YFSKGAANWKSWRAQSAVWPIRPALTWRRSGDVAQLEEHLLCKQGVAGSSPVVSTTHQRTQSPNQRTTPAEPSDLLDPDRLGAGVKRYAGTGLGTTSRALGWPAPYRRSTT